MTSFLRAKHPRIEKAQRHANMRHVRLDDSGAVFVLLNPDYLTQAPGSSITFSPVFLRPNCS